MKMPKVFVMKSYRPRDKGVSNNDLHLSEDCVGIVTNITTEETLQTVLPESPSNIPITDARFVHDANIVLPITYSGGTHWLSDEEVKKLAVYKEQILLQESIIPQIRANVKKPK
jgi:hypothetical protein